MTNVTLIPSAWSPCQMRGIQTRSIAICNGKDACRNVTHPHDLFRLEQECYTHGDTPVVALVMASLAILAIHCRRLHVAVRVLL